MTDVWQYRHDLQNIKTILLSGFRSLSQRKLELGRTRGKMRKQDEQPRKSQTFLEDGETNLQRASRRHTNERKWNNLNLLATTGSTAPFIGLFGTAGILRVFQKSVKQKCKYPDSRTWHRLCSYCNAVGLVAAIPAVIVLQLHQPKNQSTSKRWIISLLTFQHYQTKLSDKVELYL